MATATREMEAKVSRVVADAGATIVERSPTSGGHNRIVVERGGERRTYHYAQTPSDHRAGKNFIAGLKRLIRELPEPSQEPEKAVRKRKAPVQVPTPRNMKPGNTQRFTAKRRKAIAKAYLTCDLDTLCKQEDITQTQAESIILGQNGQAAEKLRREKNTLAAAAARALRKPPMPTLSPADRAKRDRRLYVYSRYGMTEKEVATHFKLPLKQVRAIITEQEKKDVE